VTEFFVSCVPPKTTAQQKRHNGQTGAYFQSKDGKAAEATYQALFLPHQPKEAHTGALQVEIILRWPWRSSESKKVRALGQVAMTTKPDADNIAKQLIDVLKSLRFFGDDASISDLIVRKRWGDNPGIRVRINRAESDRREA
jgi:Holliday junction resolvase RusA-like endonuclease